MCLNFCQYQSLCGAKTLSEPWYRQLCDAMHLISAEPNLHTAAYCRPPASQGSKGYWRWRLRRPARIRSGKILSPSFGNSFAVRLGRLPCGDNADPRRIGMVVLATPMQFCALKRTAVRNTGNREDRLDNHPAGHLSVNVNTI